MVTSHTMWWGLWWEDWKEDQSAQRLWKNRFTDLHETRTLSCKQKGLALVGALMKNPLKPLSSVVSNRAKWNRTFCPKHRLVCFHSRWKGTRGAFCHSSRWWGYSAFLVRKSTFQCSLCCAEFVGLLVKKHTALCSTTSRTLFFSIYFDNTDGFLCRVLILHLIK